MEKRSDSERKKDVLICSRLRRLDIREEFEEILIRAIGSPESEAKE